MDNNAHDVNKDLKKLVSLFSAIKSRKECAVVYGAGVRGRLLVDIAILLDVNIRYIVDKSKSLHGLHYRGIEINTKNVILPKADVILISTNNKTLVGEIQSEINDFYDDTDMPAILELNFNWAMVKKLLSQKLYYKEVGNKNKLNNISTATSHSLSEHNACQIEKGTIVRNTLLEEREALINSAHKRWHGTKLLIILPVNGHGGGLKVIVQEAKCMEKMGIDVTLYNINEYKPSFSKIIQDTSLSAIYGDELPDFLDIADCYDAVCSTYYTSVSFCNWLPGKVKSAYYVQDFEPDFFVRGSYNYEEALKSYTTVKRNILLTKTLWNYNKVQQMTGEKCTVIGPSVDIDLYKPRNRFFDSDKIVLSAMVRPGTIRRSPWLTIDVLYDIVQLYGDKIEVITFGSNILDSYCDYTFWRQAPNAIQHSNLGVLNDAEVCAVLSSSDIFVDLSEFQAMGLTSMEAMSCGCAVVVPSNGGSADFAENGINALVTNTHSKARCIEAICRLIDDKLLRTDISENAIVDICKFYPEKAAYKFLEAVF
jgi:glycosyltransferase involved in cell wall biosynthesis